jgi:hypothetical protein
MALLIRVPCTFFGLEEVGVGLVQGVVPGVGFEVQGGGDLGLGLVDGEMGVFFYKSGDGEFELL